MSNTDKLDEVLKILKGMTIESAVALLDLAKLQLPGIAIIN